MILISILRTFVFWLTTLLAPLPLNAQRPDVGPVCIGDCRTMVTQTIVINQPPASAPEKRAPKANLQKPPHLYRCPRHR